MTGTGPVAQADALIEAGDVAGAIELLTDRYRRTGRVGFAERLVTIRHERFSVPDSGVSFDPPVANGSPMTTVADPVAVADLDVRALRHGLSTAGHVRVNGLVGPDRCAELRDGIDRALEAFDAGMSGTPREETSPYFRKFRPTTNAHRMSARQFMRDSGGMWTVDSPHMLTEVCALLEGAGLVDLVTNYLGERPALSANKCNLRRVPAVADGNWHQDGAFLGAETRSVNVWIALSDCGVDAPGLDIVPTRFDEIVATGTDGAIFDWSVAPDVATQAAGAVGVVRPEFRAGDVLLFDHLFLHRTGVAPEMTKPRYAIETWLFGPSKYPEGQIPLVL